MNLQRLLMLVVLLAAAGPTCFAQSTASDAAALEIWLDPDGALWKQTPDQFIGQHARLGFVWVSAAKNLARSAQPRLRFAGLRVWEAIARFDTNALSQLTFSLYNRGDSGELSEEVFGQLLGAIDKAVDGWAGAKGVMLRAEDRTSAITIRRKAWVKGPHRLDLVWSFTPKHHDQGMIFPYRAEYVRLQISRAAPASALNPQALLTTPIAAPTRTLNAIELRAHVTRTPTGDAFISGIPMVDQGPKGYCAVAVAERVLRYYGKQVDQHEIAQLTNTTSGNGTSPEAMITALRRCGDKWDVQINIHDDFRLTEFEKLIHDYNRSAKTANKPPIQLNLTYGSVIDLGEIYRAMDGDLLKQARLKREAALGQFKTLVTKYVNAGMPLVWAVMLGKVKEQALPQAFGGHMRLIIGCNDRTGEILYSDTWGAGHELKRMPLADAWTITMGLYTIEPRNIRF